MKFSILVPVYNVENYLEQCVDSLLNQTYTGEYEIILVNDGSTDSSGNICDEYSRRYPEKVKTVHKKNGGHTSARLTAIKEAKGDFCLFADSDDFVQVNLLETVNNVLLRNPDTDVVNYSFSYYENGNKKPRKQEAFTTDTVVEADNKKILYELLITTPLLNSLCTKAIKAKILKANADGYSKILDKAIAEDAYMVTDIITAAAKIVCINEPLYNYRTNPESISRSYLAETIPKKNMLELLPAWGMDDTATREKVNLACLNNAIYLFLKFYKNANNAKQRKSILLFDWSSMLTEDLHNNYDAYTKYTSGKIYCWLKNKQHFSIRWFFFKECIRKNLKKTLRRLRLR